VITENCRMSWFDPSALSKYSSYAKTALKSAQKNIDKVLEISDETEQQGQ